MRKEKKYHNMERKTSKPQTDLKGLKKVVLDTEQQSQEPKLCPKSRFRRVVRLVMANLSWLQDVEEQSLGDNVKINVILLKKKGKKSVLTLQERSILMKPTSERTEQEKRRLNHIAHGIKCFRRYPEEVRLKLVQNTYFLYYLPNRVIVRQGQPAHALYFVLSGEVTISIMCFDHVANKMVKTDVGIMVAGDIFGEVSLLHNVPRTATVTTATKCELLLLWREDFTSILRESVQEQWNLCQASLKMFPYFDDWSTLLIRECCILSRTVEFAPGQTVLGDGTGSYNYVHFLLKGQCKLIEKLMVASSNTHGPWRYRLYREGSPQQQGEIVQPYFMQVCLYNKLECFNLGEDLTDRHIVAVSPTNFLLCPMYWIMQNNHMNIWTRVRRFLERNTPSKELLFHEFVANRRWVEYKSKLLQEIYSRRKIPLNTTIDDVPYSIRMQHRINVPGSNPMSLHSTLAP